MPIQRLFPREYFAAVADKFLGSTLVVNMFNVVLQCVFAGEGVRAKRAYGAGFAVYHHP